MEFLRIIMLVFFGINSVFVTLNFLQELTSIKLKQLFEQQKQKGGELAEKAITEISETESATQRASKGFGMFVGLIVFIGILSAFIWIPTTLWINTNFQIAMVAYLAINFLFSFIQICILLYKREVVERFEFRVSRIIMFMMFRYQLAFYVFFGFKKSVIDFSIVFYNSSALMNSTILISFLISYFFVIIFTPYIYIVLMRYADKKKKIKSAILRLDATMIIGILSSFAALFFITDVLSSKVNLLLDISFMNTLDLVKIILSSILIPTIFLVLSSARDFTKKNK